MKVTLRLHQASEPMVFENIKNCYTKGGLFCMRLAGGDTLKFPLMGVFSIKEHGGYTSQLEESGRRRHR